LWELQIYLKLFRVGHYIKNLFVFAPLFFIFQIDLPSITKASVAFILFCLLASAVYIVNDIFDKKADRRHPIKKSRPIASEKVSIQKALVLVFMLVTLVFIGAMFINIKLFYVLIAYFIMNILYSILLKYIPVIDVIIISFGFLFRVLAGSYAVNILASDWILGMTFVLALFLGFSKRRGELLLLEKKGSVPKNLQLYSFVILNRLLIFLSVLIVFCYICYTFSEEVMVRIGSPYVFITSVWVILGIYRYIKIVLSNTKYSDPTTVVLRDRKLQSVIFAWVLTFIFIKYL